MAEYLKNESQNVALNAPILFDNSIPCNRGNVYHEDETGIFILRGKCNNSCNQFARYQVICNCNVEIPTGGAVTPVAIAISINGEERPTSKAIFTPSAVETLGNLTSVAVVTVPAGCCFSCSVRYVDATTDDAAVTPTPVIAVQNANLTINRIA